MEAETENPWLREPDIDRFQSHGLRCVLHRSMPMSVWCGYVGVKPNHPFYGLDRDTKHPRLEWSLDRRLTGKVQELELGLGLLLNVMTGELQPTLANVIRVHGGLTFANKGGEYKGDFLGRGFWWIGFDCAHGWDYMPGLYEKMPDAAYWKEQNPYRTYEYVREETVKLAAQLSIFN